MSRDDEIVGRMRAAGPEATAMQLVAQIQEVVGAPVTDSHFIFYFNRAFPEIPLRELIRLADWCVLRSGGEVSTEDVENSIRQWLRSPGK